MKKYIKIIIPILFLIIISIILVIKKQENQEIVEEIVEESIEQTKEEQEEIKKIKVDIKGEVKKPGVYELEEGKRVNDVIKKAEGLTENADTTLLNLSKNLTDEMVIIIYNKNEIEKLRKDITTTQTVIQYIEKECSCPDTINDACIKKAETNENKKEEASKDNKVSINTGTLEELTTIPGIGESKAKAIIEYREKNGNFKDIEEIKNISGIGESTFEKFKDYITI